MLLFLISALGNNKTSNVKGALENYKPLIHISQDVFRQYKAVN